MPTPQPILSWGRLGRARAEPASPEQLLHESCFMSLGVTCTSLRAPSYLQMRRRVYKGIPPQVRGQAWSLLLDLEKVKAENQGKYQVWPLHLCLRDPRLSPDFLAPPRLIGPGPTCQESHANHADTESRVAQVPPSITLRPPIPLRGTESQGKGQKPRGKSKVTPQKPWIETTRPDEHSPD